jgi:tripartite-type tricarboxylate transporter receptor subunit TctC
MFRLSRCCLLALLAFTVAQAHTPALAQSYPSKPVTIIVPLAAGTGMDTLARLYSEQLSHALGKPVVIENKPGAGLMLGTAAIAAAPPDGHTLGISTATPMAVNQVLYKKMSYDPDKDLTPVYFYVKSPFVLVVNPALPINSVPELIKYARESANPMSYSTPGAGTSQHWRWSSWRSASASRSRTCRIATRRNPSPTSPPATSTSASPKPAHPCR